MEILLQANQAKTPCQKGKFTYVYVSLLLLVFRLLNTAYTFLSL